MTRPLAESDHGPSIAFREYSFLERPQAAELNKSTVVLQVCPVRIDAACRTSARACPCPNLGTMHVESLGGPPEHPRPIAVQDDSSEPACSDGTSGSAADKLRAQLDEKQLAAVLTKGPVAEAKVGVVFAQAGLKRPATWRAWCKMFKASHVLA